MVWYGMVWYGMVWYGMVWYGMVWYGMVWYGMVWYGMVWYKVLMYDIACGVWLMVLYGNYDLMCFVVWVDGMVFQLVYILSILYTGYRSASSGNRRELCSVYHQIW